MLYDSWDEEFEAWTGDKDLERNQDALFERMLADKRIVSILAQHKGKKKGMILPWRRLVAAACLLLLSGLAAFWFYRQIPTIDADKDLANQQHIIQPGSNKARILFEDGSFVELEKIKQDTFLQDQGLRIYKQADGSIAYAYTATKETQKPVYNTIVTPKGGEYSLVLPDGSKVWLNAASKLRYPLSFGADSRTVELEGEAYFEVEKVKKQDTSIPFYVQTKDQKLQVLGTKFNINSYNNKIKTTLIEGAVALHYAHQAKPKHLKPSQQSDYSVNEKDIQIKDVDPSYSIAWKSGNFAFDDASIEQVMEEVARWYDIDISYQGDMSKIRYSGTISRFEKFEQLLQLIEWTDLVTFKVDGRRVTVMK